MMSKNSQVEGDVLESTESKDTPQPSIGEFGSMRGCQHSAILKELGLK